MAIMGIDPGARGAFALLDGCGSIIAIRDMPVTLTAKGRARVCPALVAAIVRELQPDSAIVELVGAMPGQGVSSMFTFGRAAGIILGVLAGLNVPVTEVSPASWKSSLRVPAAKDGARARASQLFPGAAHHWPLVKHDGRAEAALLALYGANQGRSAQMIEW